MADPPTSKLDWKQHAVGPTRSSSLWSCVAEIELNRMYVTKLKHKKYEKTPEMKSPDITATTPTLKLSRKLSLARRASSNNSSDASAGETP